MNKKKSKVVKIAVLGPAGTYTEVAARLAFRDGVCPKCGGMLEAIGNKMRCEMCGRIIKRKPTKITKKTIDAVWKDIGREIRNSKRKKGGDC